MEMAVDNLSIEKHFAHGLHGHTTVSQELKYALEEFGVGTKSSICVLVTSSGLVVSEAVMGAGMNGDIVSAYSASLLNSVLRAGEALKQGNTRVIELEYDNSRMVLTPVNSGLLLVAVVPPYIPSRFVEAEIKKCASRVREIME